MSTKIIVFIAKVSFAFIISALTFGIGATFSTSLNINCILQNDGAYTCQAQDTLFGWAFSERQAEHVVSLEHHVKCSGNGNRKGCSQISEFITTAGEKVQLSNLFTGSKSQVAKLVNTINGLMKTKSTPINYTSDLSPWLIFSISLSSFLFIMFLLQAFLSLLQKNNEPIITILK